MVTEAAMQHVKEPHARLPRDEERGAMVRVGRGQELHPPNIHSPCMAASSRPDLIRCCHREA